MKGIGALLRVTQNLLLPAVHHVETQQTVGNLQPGKGPSREFDHAGAGAGRLSITRPLQVSRNIALPGGLTCIEITMSKMQKWWIKISRAH